MSGIAPDTASSDRSSLLGHSLWSSSCMSVDTCAKSFHVSGCLVCARPVSFQKRLRHSPAGLVSLLTTLARGNGTLDVCRTRVFAAPRWQRTSQTRKWRYTRPVVYSTRTPSLGGSASERRSIVSGVTDDPRLHAVPGSAWSVPKSAAIRPLARHPRARRSTPPQRCKPEGYRATFDRSSGSWDGPRLRYRCGRQWLAR